MLDHRIAPLVPNYIFHVVRDESGSVTHAFTYACVGKLPPIIGPELFSFNVLTRSSNHTADELAQFVQDAVDLVGEDVLKVDGMKYTSQDDYTECGVATTL